MTSKTREFKLSELTTFDNELIHFFNINPNNSSIYINLEVEGKKIKINNPQKIILKDVISNNEELDFNFTDDIEIKMKFKIMDKFNKKEIFESFQTKMRESKIRWNQNRMKGGAGVIETGVSIKERIKMFSGGEKSPIKNNLDKNKPGKLKMPTMFQSSNKS